MNRPASAKVKLSAREIGENIASWRKLYGLTSQQLADRAAISRSTLSRLENGDSSVSFTAFLSVCRALSPAQLDAVVESTDPYETDFGRARADWALPKRVRRPL